MPVARAPSLRRASLPVPSFRLCPLCVDALRCPCAHQHHRTRRMDGWAIAVLVPCLVVGVLLLCLVGPLLYTFLYSIGLNRGRDVALVRCMGHAVTHTLVAYTNAVLGLLRAVTAIMSKEANKTRANLPDAPCGGVCFYGDSEFTYWHHLTHDLSGWRWDCYNAGFGGSRTSDLLRHARMVLECNPEIIVVHCGRNDWNFRSWGAAPSDVAAEAAAALLSLFTLFEQHPSIRAVFYLLTSRAPIDTEQSWQYMVDLAARVQQRLPSKTRVIDLRDVMHPLDHYYVDHVHLNAEGHAANASAFLAKIRALQIGLGAPYAVSQHCSVPFPCAMPQGRFV